MSVHNLNQFSLSEQPWGKGRGWKGQRCSARRNVCAASPSCWHGKDWNVSPCTRGSCPSKLDIWAALGVLSDSPCWVLRCLLSHQRPPPSFFSRLLHGPGWSAPPWWCLHAEQLNLNILVWIMLIADCYNFGFSNLWIGRLAIRTHLWVILGLVRVPLALVQLQLFLAELSLGTVKPRALQEEEFVQFLNRKKVWNVNGNNSLDVKYVEPLRPATWLLCSLEISVKWGSHSPAFLLGVVTSWILCWNTIWFTVQRRRLVLLIAFMVD